MVFQWYTVLFLLLCLDSVQSGSPSIDRCPGTIFRRVASNDATVSVFWEEPNCGLNAQSTHSQGSQFGPGVHTIIYWFSGGSLSNENQRCCSFDVFVAGPDFDLCSQNVCQQGETCVPEIDRYFCYPGNTNIDIRNCSGTVIIRKLGTDPVIAEWIEPTAFDHYGHILNHFNVPRESPGTPLDLGEHVVEYAFSDGRGTASCNVKVIVAENTGPGFQNCPNDITVRSSKPMVRVDWLEPLLQTNEDSSRITVTQTHSPGQLFPVPSVTTVIYTFTDTNSDRSNTCSFQIFTGPPSQETLINGLSGKFFYVEQSAQNSVEWPRPFLLRTSDDNNPPLIVTPSRVQPDIRPGSITTHRYPKGVYPVTYNFTDVDGNHLATVEFVVAYYNTDQRTEPTFSCSSSPSVISLSSEIPAVVSWNVPQVEGDEADLVWTEEPPYRPIKDLFPVGATILDYLFYSPGSNTTHQCRYVVHISDNIAPRILDCPCDMRLTAPLGGILTVNFPSVINAYDGSDGAITPSTSSLQPPLSLGAGQSQVVSYDDFIDSSFNRASCSFTIEVEIEEPPQIEPAVITNCLDRVLLSTTAGFAVLPIDQYPMAIHKTNPSGYLASITTNVFTVNTEILVIATFPALVQNAIPFEGESSCEFTVLVLDDVPPIIQNCSQEISVSAKTGQNFVRVNWIEPNSVDRFQGGELVTSTGAPGDPFPVGETSVVWYIFEDDVGLQTNCSINITVEKASTVNCPSEPGTSEPFSFTSDTIVVIVVTAVATFVFSLAIFLMSLCCCTCCCVVDTAKTNTSNNSSSEVHRTRLFVKIGGKNIPIYGPVTPLSNSSSESGIEREIDDEEFNYDMSETAFSPPYQNERMPLPSLSERVLNSDQPTTASANNYIEHDLETKNALKPPVTQRVIDEESENTLYGYDDTPGTIKEPPRPKLPPKPGKRNGPALLEKNAFHAMQAAVQSMKEEQAWKGREIDDEDLYGFDKPANM